MPGSPNLSLSEVIGITSGSRQPAAAYGALTSTGLCVVADDDQYGSTHMRQRIILALLLAISLLLAACGGDSGSGDDSQSSAGEPVKGGSLTVLEDTAFAGSWPTGLDPATNTTGGANTALGQHALFSNTLGANNAAVGQGAPGLRKLSGCCRDVVSLSQETRENELTRWVSSEWLRDREELVELVGVARHHDDRPPVCRRPSRWAG